MSVGLKDFAITLLCIVMVIQIGFLVNLPGYYGQWVAKAVKAYNQEMAK